MQQTKSGYVCFWKNQRAEVYADNALLAREIAKQTFFPKCRKDYEITVVLAERSTGEIVALPTTFE